MQQVSTVLDKETQLLIAVGSAVAAGCVPCLQNIVSLAHEEGIDEKRLRAAARTGQFIKDKPTVMMKTFCDDLLGTHLQSMQETVSCPAQEQKQEVSEASVSCGDTSGSCGCS